MLSGSRAGLASLVVGSTFFVGWLAYSSRADLARQLGLASIGAVGALVLVALAADQAVVSRARQHRLPAKLSVFRDALPMIGDYWALGGGRGAFESAFSSYHRPLPGDFALVVSRAENFPIQFLAEWGVLVGGAALLARAAALFTFARRRRRDPAAVALGVGIGTLLLQNLDDLGLEIPAVSAALIVVWAAAIQPSGALATPRAWWRAASFVLPGALVLFFAAPSAFHTAQDDRAELGGAWRSPRRAAPRSFPLRRDLEAALARTRRTPTSRSWSGSFPTEPTTRTRCRRSAARSSARPSRARRTCCSLTCSPSAELARRRSSTYGSVHTTIAPSHL